MKLEATKQMPKQNLLNIRKYGKHDAVNYVRTFLGHELVFIPISQVLIFSAIPNLYRTNPFIKQAMDSIHYNQIEIIAYDDGTLGNTKEEYYKILNQCGYSYIRVVVLATEFHKKKCSYRFFKKMISTYNKENRKYGIISHRMNIYAKLKHLDFLLYTSPYVYPRRYYFGKKLKPEEKLMEAFVNEELFCGSIHETKGYHFGFVFQGIFIYNFIRFIKEHKEKQKVSTVYFTENSNLVCEAYLQIYPGDDVQMLYVGNRTERNESLRQYLEKNLRKKASILIDFSIQEEFKTYIHQKVSQHIEILSLKEYFSKEILLKYGDDIHQMVELSKESCFYVKQYKEEFPVWEEDISIEDMCIMQEKQRGVTDFAKRFDEVAKSCPQLYFCYGSSGALFSAKVIHYAFDDRENSRKHMEPMQRITKSKLAKTAFNLVRRFYKIVKRR